MATAVIDSLNGFLPPPSEIGSLGAFFRSPSTTAEQNLGRSDERLVRELVGVLDRQLLSAVGARSVKELQSIRRYVMPRYARALRALQDTALNLLSDKMVNAIIEGVFAELVEDLSKQTERFGEKLTDQAVFTLWTVRKINALAQQIVGSGGVSPENVQTDIALLHEYHDHSLWAQFHLDMMFAAMKFDRPICEEIRDSVCEGLRAAVNAYVVMKDAYALRHPATEGEDKPPSLPWDSEDEELLASSMRDIGVSPSNRHTSR